MKMWKIPLFDLNYDDREQAAVMAVLQDKWLSMGPRTQAFEEKFADYLGGGMHCCAVSSCTAALHMALLVNGVGPGDEVVLSGLTFVAALNVVVLLGATPVLADSRSLHDWNVSCADAARKISPRTKALVIVHYAGQPCELDELKALCRQKNIVLIEDAAHAVGAEYRGGKCGTFGTVGCFSFFSNKNLSVGEGGMLVTPLEEVAEKARYYRSHGMSRLTFERHAGDDFSYDVIQPGFNYRIDEMRAALGIVQLDKLDDSNRRRAEIAADYIDRLAVLPELTIPWRNPVEYRTSANHIFPVLLPESVSRHEFMTFMKNRGIQTSIHYPAFADFSYYRRRSGDRLPIAGEISRRAVTLPLFPGMGSGDIRYVADSVIGFMNRQKGAI
jgi:dTDP-4-amino-4,6-dideoxygalactose transaminase